MVIFMNGENLTCLSTDTLLLSYSAVVFFLFAIVAGSFVCELKR